MEKLIIVLLAMFLIHVYPAYASSNVVESHSQAVSEEQTAFMKKMEQESDGFFHVEGTKGLATKEADAEEFKYNLIKTGNLIFRDYEYLEMGLNYSIDYTDEESTKGIWFITAEQIQKLINIKNRTETWLEGNMQNVVSDGMNRDDAVKAVYSWIVTNTEFSEDTDYSYRSAVSLFETKKGSFISYHLAFRAMLEAIPFNDDWVVDFGNGTNHISVSIINTPSVTETDRHYFFAGIQNPDETWSFYELTYIKCYGKEIYGVDWETIKSYCKQPLDESYTFYD